MRGFSKLRFWPLLHTLCRGFAQNVDKGLLSKLRKQTGIPFINCKKALAKFDNDFEQAKKWLLAEAQKEGWARVGKLQERPMSQGLVAVMSDSKQATMIEVNCETDFVARNEKFVAMVTKLVHECSVHFEKSSEKEISVSKKDLDKIVASDKSTLADFVALNVGSLGENMTMRRGIFLRADKDCILSSYVHPSGTNKPKSVHLGKYSALVELKQKAGDKPVINLKDLGSHLCQHIVGMNPKTVGEYVPQEQRSTEKVKASPAETSTSGNEDSGYSSDASSDTESSSPADTEDRLLQQEFLLDTSMTVGELMCINGVEVLQFRRFACGEEIEGENED